MAKFEAIIDLTVEIDAENSDQSDELMLSLTNQILALAGNTYKIWIDTRQVDEVSN